MSAIAARPDIFVLLQRVDKRPSEWGPARLRVTKLDGSVVEGLLDGWDSEVVTVRNGESHEIGIAIGRIAKVEAHGANMPLELTAGLITGLLVIAPLVFLARDSAQRYAYWLGALILLASFFGDKFTRRLSESRLGRRASKWNVLYEVPRE